MWSGSQLLAGLGCLTLAAPWSSVAAPWSLVAGECARSLVMAVIVGLAFVLARLSLFKVFPHSMAVGAVSFFSMVLFSFSKASSHSLVVGLLRVSSHSLVVGGVTLSSTLNLILVAQLDGYSCWPLPVPRSTWPLVPGLCFLSCSCCCWFLLPPYFFCPLSAVSCP